VISQLSRAAFRSGAGGQTRGAYWLTRREQRAVAPARLGARPPLKFLHGAPGGPCPWRRRRRSERSPGEARGCCGGSGARGDRASRPPDPTVSGWSSSPYSPQDQRRPLDHLGETQRRPPSRTVRELARMRAASSPTIYERARRLGLGAECLVERKAAKNAIWHGVLIKRSEATRRASSLAARTGGLTTVTIGATAVGGQRRPSRGAWLQLKRQ
jgi:hypothetical protein